MKPEGNLKRFLDSQKVQTKIVGPVERMLLGRDPWDMYLGNGEIVQRRWDRIHPSELAGNDWCPRAAFYRISRGPIEGEKHRFQTQVIFEEGHEYHRKWQMWAWDLGVLRGRFNCAACMPSSETFDATSPAACPKCGASRRALDYREVPLKAESHLITGSSDGDLDEGGDPEDEPLIEIKSIGIGTIRMEAPGLIRKHTYKVELENGKTKTLLDQEGLWRDIRRPLPSHLRQGLIYCWVLGRRSIVFVYEFKPDGRSKEFHVKADFKYIEDLLDECLDVKHALDTGNPPPCKQGKQRCAICSAYEESSDVEESEPEEEPRSRSQEGASRGRKKVVRRGRPGTARASERGSSSESSAGHRGSRRRRPDVADDSPHSLVRMAQREADVGGDRSGEREGATGAGAQRGDPRRKRRVVRKRH